MIGFMKTVGLWVSMVIARSGDQERPRGSYFDFNEWWAALWFRDLQPLFAFIGVIHLFLDALIVVMIVIEYKRRQRTPAEGKGE